MIIFSKLTTKCLLFFFGMHYRAKSFRVITPIDFDLFNGELISC